MHIYFLIYPLIGIFAGLIAGLLGLGGGIVLVPCLSIVFPLLGFDADVSMHLALGTSMATITVTTSSALRAHLKKGKQAIIKAYLKKLGVGIVVGALIGVSIAHLLSSHSLELIFGVLVLLLAIRVALLGRQPEPGTATLPKPPILTGMSIVIGILSSLLGLSGGVFFGPLLQHYKVRIHDTVEITSMCGLLLSTIGTLSYMAVGYQSTASISWSTGYVYWPAFIGIAITSMLFAPLGVKLAHRLPAPILRWLFVGFLVIVSLKMLIF